MKTVFVTGATRSIGLETSKQLIAQGYCVYIGCRDLAKGESLANEINAEGKPGLAKAVQIDVTDAESVAAAQSFVEKDFGSLDILINNAGISGRLPQNASNAPLEDIREAFETNFFGTISVTQSFLSLLKKSDNPIITNITSGLSSLTLHDDPNWIFYAFKGASYGPSKTALNAYTQALAFELKDTNFKVNVVDPGFTATDFNQNRGHGNVKDAAAFIIKHTLLGEDDPTGMFYSNDMDNETKVSPW